MQLSDKHKNLLRKIWKISWQSALIAFITLCLFEIIYRNYWVDFYRTELEALNPEDDLALKKDHTVLIFGDSFTADPNGWTKNLRDSLEDYNVINSAIPGTSVFHHTLFFEDRIEEFNPDQIIFQLYVGNDLIDYNRPQSFSKISWARNLYWWLSDQFISLQFLNYKTGQFKASGNQNGDKINQEFSTENYNSRTLNYISANPEILMESINPKEDLDDEMEDLIEDLKSMLEETSIRTTIVVIPHCIQVHPDHQDNYLKMGAAIDFKHLDDFLFFTEVEQLEKEFDHLSVITPLDEFINSDATLYYNNDPHLTSTGQDILGKYMLTHVEF